MASIVGKYELGEFQETRKLALAALKTDAKNPELLNVLAACSHAMGAMDEAHHWIQKALQIAPSHPVLRTTQATILGQLGDHASAVRVCKGVLKDVPGFQPAIAAMAEVYRKAGRLDAAAQLYQQLINDRPDSAAMHFQLAVVLKNMARFDESAEAFKRSIALRRDHARAYWGLSEVRKATPNDNRVASMRACLAGEPSPGDAKFFHYALFNELSALGHDAEAMTHLHEANRLKRAAVMFDLEDAKRDFLSYKRFFSAKSNRQFVTPRGAARAGGPKAIFIIGMPRSGTTLAEQILAAHPEVETAGESQAIGLLLSEVSAQTRQRVPECLAGLGADDYRKLGERYEQGLAKLFPNASYVINKLPQNYLHVGLIHRMLPEAPIILIRHHPYEVCLSNYKQHYAQGQNYSYDLRELAGYYRLFDDLMTHWRRVLPGRMIEIRYDDLVENPQPTIERMQRRCGLPLNIACLRHNKRKSAIRTASAIQAKQPIYKSSMGSWKRFADELGPLFEALPLDQNGLPIQP